VNNLQIVKERIAAGDGVRFYHDHYGQQWIELRRGWVFKRKTRIKLLPDELMQAKAALQERHRRRSTGRK
jgi:hypothetical protein